MRNLFKLLVALGLFWLAAVVTFVATMPTQSLSPSIKADALVVLTGGQDRVEHGLTMLAEQAAPVLLISGAGQDVTEEQLLDKHASEAVRSAIYETGGEIVLDHVARSTVSNADQTASFIRARDIRRIRLITANYHMHRSLYEFRLANPGIEIMPDPVFPEGFERDHWWQHENTRRLVFSEFNKYLAVMLRDQIRPTSELHE